MEYSRIYKLTRSALELRRTSKTVLEIALDFGYASPESFTRAFKNFYSITPSEYRKKYMDEAVTWHDLSGKIAISRFRRTFPELNVSDIDLALDFCFTHNPLKYAEDIVGMTVAESEILTLGNSEPLEHFVYVSDYNSAVPAVVLVCETESDALPYLKLLGKLTNPRFSVRKSVDTEWESFEAEVAKLGLTRRCGYDMIYPKFENGKLVCLAMPTLDRIREFRKYDIGAIFTLNSPNKEQAIDLMWKYAIESCIQDNAAIGNANSDEDDSPLGLAVCERNSLVKVAKNCRYSS